MVLGSSLISLFLSMLVCSDTAIGTLFLGEEEGIVVITELPLAGKAGGIFFWK